MNSNHRAPRTVSRRAVLGTAGAGAVGAAAVTFGVMTVLGDDKESAPPNTAANADAAVPQEMVDASPVVVYFEPATRQLTVFSGVDEFPVDDADLGNRVWQLAQNK